MRKTTLLFSLCIALCLMCAVDSFAGYRKAWSPDNYVSSFSVPGSFVLSRGGVSATILVGKDEWPGVIRAAGDLSADIGRVTGTPSSLKTASKPEKRSVVVGTIGHSDLIDKLIAKGKIDVSGIVGQWESFMIQTVDSYLVVVGSDRRGTIYGLYDISEQIGVSPWYWWADVPARHSDALYVKAGRYVQESPKVKYRGIFINDESPSFTGWARAHYSKGDGESGMNSDMYSHMFELILRLKGNYLWPAMWGNAFNEDDPMNPEVADMYGIVMGTSHHEPMMRAQKEYTVRKDAIGDWDYVTNSENLKEFWREGLERNSKYENVITIGMRGDGDVAMGKGDDSQNIEVLNGVLTDQRKIISDIYGDRPVTQMWALFTEVQRYYDAGMQSPDDIMLLFCDNNWGYIRRTGPAKEQDRKGGMGLYYHIDMNGGPWNDRWINTTTFPKLQNQLSLAYKTGIDDLWLINVGDLKPKELPIDFIMHFAWDPDAITAENTYDYALDLAESLFGPEYRDEIAYIITKYPKLNLMRKPEVQTTRIFSHANYREAERVMAEWKDLSSRTEDLAERIPTEYSDAFYELVYYPVIASAGVAEMYLLAGLNNIQAYQGDPQANETADRILTLFEKDKALAAKYNDDIAGGKWKNMMSDIHIGYFMWSMPREAALPTLYRVNPGNAPAMGVALEGSDLAWPAVENAPVAVEGTGLRREDRLRFTDEEKQASPSLPVFDVLGDQEYSIKVFNRGTGSFRASIYADADWVILPSSLVTVSRKSVSVPVKIDWKKAPAGRSEAMVDISHEGGETVTVKVVAVNGTAPAHNAPFYGRYAGEFSIDAGGFSRNVPGKNAGWVFLPDLGRGAGCMGIEPVTAPSSDANDAPRLEYNVFIPESGPATFLLGIKPTQDVNPARGLRIAVGIDGGEPVVIDARKGMRDEFSEYTPENLARSTVLKALPRPSVSTYTPLNTRLLREDVFDDMRWLDVQLGINAPGVHTLEIYMVDPEIVLEKIIVNPDGRYSYLGPEPKLIR